MREQVGLYEHWIVFATSRVINGRECDAEPEGGSYSFSQSRSRDCQSVDRLSIVTPSRQYADMPSETATPATVALDGM